MKSQIKFGNFTKALPSPPLFVLSSLPTAFAQVGTSNTWTGATDNNWNEAGNWDPNEVPATGGTADPRLAFRRRGC